MSKYFVYFSASGNGDFIANFLKEKGYEIVKVETLKTFGKVNFFRILLSNLRRNSFRRGMNISPGICRDRCSRYGAAHNRKERCSGC